MPFQGGRNLSGAEYRHAFRNASTIPPHCRAGHGESSFCKTEPDGRLVGPKWTLRSIGPRIGSMYSSSRVWESRAGKSASVPECCMRVDSEHGWRMLGMACRAMNSLPDAL